MLIPNKNLPLEIIHEDEALIVINKPLGIPVYPLKSEETETVANALVARYPECDGVGSPLEAGIVHRLDNTTSGLLVVARTNEVYTILRKKWNTDEMTKVYTALVLGKTEDTGIIQTPIAHHPSKKKKMMVCETKEKIEEYKAKNAQTNFLRRDTYTQLGQPHGVAPTSSYSLLSIKITTGVRHQIRVHLSSIGHPLVGDKLYQNPKKQTENQCGLNRPFLHLSRIELNHPMTKERMCFEVPLAEDLEEVLNRFL